MPDDIFAGLLLATKSSSQADHDYLKQLNMAKHGAEVIDQIGLYAVWFAFDFAFNHEDAGVFGWCANLIRGFAADMTGQAGDQCA